MADKPVKKPRWEFTIARSKGGSDLVKCVVADWRQEDAEERVRRAYPGGQLVTARRLTYE